MATCTCANPNAVKSAISSFADDWSSGMDEIHRTLYGASQGGSPGTLAPLRFAHWAAPEITDKGYNAWAKLFQAAALIIALANAAAQGEIHSKQMDLAEGYYDMAKYKWDRFAAKYIPLEKKLVYEVGNEPVRELNCTDDRARAVTSVNSSFSSSSSALNRLAKAYRVCLDPTLVDYMEHKRMVALTDTENYNLYDDRFYTDMRNDRRWNRRSAVLNLGRNLASQALKYGDIAKSMLSTVGAEIDQAARGMVQALGYYGARNDTFYPTTYLAPNSGGMNAQLVNVGGGSSSINPAAMSPAG